MEDSIGPGHFRPTTSKEPHTMERKSFVLRLSPDQLGELDIRELADDQDPGPGWHAFTLGGRRLAFKMTA
jgi:hypothetical protein